MKHNLNRRQLLSAGFALTTAALLPKLAYASQEPEDRLSIQRLNAAKKLVEAARSQVGKTIYYNGAYVGLSYPNGDLPIETGVCTDVIIRAYRQAFGFDLQKAIHEDMKNNFSAYPTIWGAKGTDRNIDHRRVPNQQTFFKRQGAQLATPLNAKDPKAFQAGDLVTQMLPGNLPHILIVSDKKSRSGTPLVIHNIGRGAQEEDILFSYNMTGHYRFFPNLLRSGQ